MSPRYGRGWQSCWAAGPAKEHVTASAIAGGNAACSIVSRDRLQSASTAGCSGEHDASRNLLSSRTERFDGRWCNNCATLELTNDLQSIRRATFSYSRSHVTGHGQEPKPKVSGSSLSRRAPSQWAPAVPGGRMEPPLAHGKAIAGIAHREAESVRPPDTRTDTSTQVLDDGVGDALRVPTLGVWRFRSAPSACIACSGRYPESEPPSCDCRPPCRARR